MKIDDMEKKLADYRRAQKREAHYKELKSIFKNKLTPFFSKGDNNKETKTNLLEGEVEQTASKEDCFSEICETNSLNGEDSIDGSKYICTYTDWVYYCLCFTLWCIIYVIFIQLQFGTVYFIVSALIGIYYNTRTGPKSNDEISAYSVFNKDCMSIVGTTTAEQLEREMGYTFGATTGFGL